MAKKIKVESKVTRRWLRVVLTNEELLAAGKLHADRSIEFAALENDRKRIADEFKAKTSAIEAEACALAAKISSGYEFRYVPCTEYLGEPAADKKRVIRNDTGAEIGVEDMTAAEMQRELISSETATA